MFCRDEEPVDQMRLEPRLESAADDHELINIRDQDVLASAARAAEHAVAGLDALDNAVACALRPKPDAIADCHDVPLIGRERLEQPPRRAAKDLARFLVLNDAVETFDAEHAPRAANGWIDFRQDDEAAGITGDLTAGYGATPAEFALAADPLAAWRVAIFKCVSIDLSREILLTGANLAVLAEIGAKLASFAAHATSTA
jgi:hypothetical protein